MANKKPYLHGTTAIGFGLAAKLASIVVHVDEGLDAQKGHAFDLLALRSLVDDAEVKVWLRSPDIRPLIPEKRA